MWMVPPVLEPGSRLRLSVSAETPSPGNAASPCRSTGSDFSSSLTGGPAASRLSWTARAMPSTTGFTCSRWLGFGARLTSTCSSASASLRWYPLTPRGYLTAATPAARGRGGRDGHLLVGLGITQVVSPDAEVVLDVAHPGVAGAARRRGRLALLR